MLEKSNEILVRNLKARLEKLHWNVSDLSRASGITTSGLYGIVHGRRWPNPDNLDRIAKALKIPVADLFAMETQKITPDQALEVLKTALLDPAAYVDRRLSEVVQKLTHASPTTVRVVNAMLDDAEKARAAATQAPPKAVK